MWNVSLALTPASLWGVYVFGLRALIVLLVSIASSLLTEYLLGLMDGKNTLKNSTLIDGSAFLTGLLIGMNMSPLVPLWVPLFASAFAIGIVKWIFGGLGYNWMNPALGGRVFVFFSFTSLMSKYELPSTLAAVDSIGGATPLGFVKTAINGGQLNQTPSSIMASAGYPTTNFAQNIASTLNISPYTVDAFFGNIGGCIGEVSAFLLLIGGIYLCIKKIISWHVPVTFIGSFAILTWMFSGFRSGMGFASGEILTQIFSGGLFLGAIFMATDMVTSPITKKGQVIFGLGCGFFTFLIRYFGSLPEAVSLAIILMNMVVPTLDRYIMPKKFGAVKKAKEAK
jgi:electron transport complex protein RnfD